jgi:hypothetical protein
MRGVAMVTVGVGETPTVEVQLAAYLLATIDLPRIACGEPYSPKVEQLIMALHSELYGVPSPYHHWATVLLDEVEAARLQHLRLQDPDRDKPGPTTPEATFKRKRPRPGQDKQVTMSLEAEARETVPGRAVIKYFGMIDGKRTHVGTMIGSLVPGPYYPTDPIERSHAILMNTRIRLSSMDAPLQLPTFADDPLLVSWLFIRAGFAGGGGPDAVKRTTMLSWLQDPHLLATQIDDYARRRAQAGTDAEADKVEEDLTELADRVRRHAESPRVD